MDLLFLSTVPLFQGLQPGEIEALLRCVDARERRCSRGEALLRAGDVTRSLGLVLSGSVNITVHFYWGGSHIFGRMGPGEIFAETYAALPDRELMCDAVAAEDFESAAKFRDQINALKAQSAAGGSEGAPDGNESVSGGNEGMEGSGV